MGIRRDISDLAGEGIQFASFQHVRIALHQMAQRGHHYRIASSEVLRNLDGSQEEKFRYRSVVFHCVHYGSPRIRGNGCRQVSHLATGCLSFIRVTYNYRNQNLEVTKAGLDHQGHKLQVEKVGRPRYKTRIFVPKKAVVKAKQPKRKIQKKKKKIRRLSPEQEVQLQTEYIGRLMKKQQKNFAKYAKERARRRLPPFCFEPPPLDFSNLLHFYTLAANPYIVTPQMKEDMKNETFDDDEEQEEQTAEMKIKTMAMECFAAPSMLIEQNENGGGFSPAYTFDGSGDHNCEHSNHSTSSSSIDDFKECSVEVEVVNGMEQSLYGEDFIPLPQFAEGVDVTESTA